MSESVELVQVHLQQGGRIKVCWTDADSCLKTGRSITLKKVPGTWKVIWVSDTRIRYTPKQDWKVGGLE